MSTRPLRKGSRSIYATRVDYSASAEESVLFFKTVQNKMLYAATGMTAAELVSGRANALLPMMGMAVIKGKRPTLAEAWQQEM